MYSDINHPGKSTDTAFDAAHDEGHAPGTIAPYSGIYRCWGCGREVVSLAAQPLPPQTHHQHNAAHGPIRWRLIVYANHRPQ